MTTATRRAHNGDARTGAGTHLHVLVLDDGTGLTPPATASPRCPRASSGTARRTAAAAPRGSRAASRARTAGRAAAAAGSLLQRAAAALERGARDLEPRVPPRQVDVDRAEDERDVRSRIVVPSEARVEAADDRPRRVLDELVAPADGGDRPRERQRDAEDLVRRRQVLARVEGAVADRLLQQVDDGEPALGHARADAAEEDELVLRLLGLGAGRLHTERW